MLFPANKSHPAGWLFYITEALIPFDAVTEDDAKVISAANPIDVQVETTAGAVNEMSVVAE
jgi:hypothetical protein